MDIIMSSGDRETPLISNPVSHTEHIGDYISPHGEKMSFFYTSDLEYPIRIQLNDKNTEELTPLWIQELNENRNRDFLLPTVVRYLNDTNLRPEYCRLDREVRFFSVHPKDKRWILEDNYLSLPNEETLLVFQSNGCVSYVSRQNQITIWNYKDGSSRDSSIPASPSTITAMVEQNGSLIVGCEDGHIYVPNCNWICPKKSSIVEIVAIGSSHFAVRYRDESANLFVSENGSETAVFDQISRIWSFRGRFLVVLRGKRVLLVFDINTNEIFREKIFSSELENENITVVSDTICVATYEEISIWKEGSTWNTLRKEDFCAIWQTHVGEICTRKDCSNCFNRNKSFTEKNMMCAETSWQDLMTSIEKNFFVFLPSGVYIFPQILNYAIYFTYFSIFEPPVTYHVDGNWGVTSLSLLSDGSCLMYASDTRDSGIHVITAKGEHIFSKYKELTDNEKIISLDKMANGSVATRSQNLKLRVITSTSHCNSSKNLINQVTELRSSLISDPENFDLYKELAKKFLPTDYSTVFDHHSAYHTYLDGLEAAVKGKNLYQARRFYEKAKNIFSDRDEPMRLFLSYLQQFPDCKIERIIRFDSIDLLKNKNCKRRLFIGEGDFSFTEALVKKHAYTHRQLPLAIVATELRENNPGVMNDFEELNQRIDSLSKKGVRILTGIDGQKIHEHPELKDVKFKRIHWNCPFNPANRDSFRQVISNFFRSCKKIQSIGDRVHVTLMQGWEDGDWYEKRQYENPIVKGSTESCYCLIRKRRFGKQRYPEYNHKTVRGDEIHVKGVHREFVFEKVSPSVHNVGIIKDKIENSLPLNNPHKKYFIRVNKKINVSKEIKLDECYFDCSTDEDSSDYYSD